MLRRFHVAPTRPATVSVPRAAARGAAKRLLSGGGGGFRGTGGRYFHKNKKLSNNKLIAIHINKLILSSETETLCCIIKTRAAVFNHVNVATALRKALEAPRHLVPNEILGILVVSAYIYICPDIIVATLTWLRFQGMLRAL